LEGVGGIGTMKCTTKTYASRYQTLNLFQTATTSQLIIHSGSTLAALT